MKLRYVMTEDLKALGLRGSVVAEVSGLRIVAEDQRLEAIKAEAAAELMALTEDAIRADAVLEGYRALVRGLGRSLKKFPPAAENLIEQVRRTGRFPRINTAVDAYNTVVVRRKLALGVHDIAKLGPTIFFRMSEGGEPFTPVGGAQAKATQRGDFVYADENRVLAWLDSKDSDDVKVSPETTNLVVVIQGTAQTTRDYNAAAAEEACRLITSFCGGSYEIAPVP